MRSKHEDNAPPTRDATTRAPETTPGASPRTPATALERAPLSRDSEVFDSEAWDSLADDFDSIEADLLGDLGEEPESIEEPELIGAQVGPYRVEAEVGRGGMGRVFRAVHVHSGHAAALKVVRADMATRPRYKEGFRREVQAIAALTHPGIVRLYDYGHLDAIGSPWCAMEFAPLGSLSDREPRASWNEARAILVQILEALAHAHARGVVHRDLKPDNVLVRGDAPLRCVLTDFGLAHPGTRAMDQARWVSRPGDAGVTEAMVTAGTPAYMAPEQFRGDWRDYGPWTDLYALGCLAWELICGAPPFLAWSPEALAHKHENDPRPPLTARFEVPDALEGWLHALLAPVPHERTRRAADALRGLGEEPTRRRLASQQAHGHVGLGLFGLREIPLIGRADAQALIRGALAEVAQTGETRAVVVQGPSGAGKSRLVEWMTEQAHATGQASVFAAFHSPVAGPGDGLGRAVASHLGCVGLSRPETLARLQALSQRPPYADLLMRDDPLGLTEIVAPDAAGEPEGPRLTFESDRERHVVVRRLLEAEAARRPVVVWLDDVQWGADSLVFADLLARSPRLPVLVLLTVREEALSEQPHEARLLEQLLDNDNVTRLALDTLPEGDRERLVAGLLKLTPELTRAATHAAGGSPLYAIQLVNEWVERDLLTWTPDGFTARGELPRPATPAELWRERLQGLLVDLEHVEQARPMLQLAAALGQQLDAHEWRVACEQADLPGAERIEPLVEAMVVHRLARRQAGGWSFVHGKLREALEEEAREQRAWGALNLACADMIEVAYPQKTTTLIERRALHLIEADALEDALELLLEAAERYITIDNNERGLLLLERYAQLVEQLGLPPTDPRRGAPGPHRVVVLLHQEAFVQARDAIQPMLEEAREQGWTRLTCTLLTRLGEIHQGLSNVDEGLEAFGDALEVLERHLPDWLEMKAHILHNVARFHYEHGRVDLARSTTERALEAAREGGDPIGEAWSVWMRSCIALSASELEAAKADCLESKAIFDRCGHRRGSAHCVNSLAEIARFQGDHEEALAGYLHTIDLCYAVGLPQAHTFGRLNVCLAWLGLGRYDEAIAKLKELEVFYEEAERSGELAVVRAALALGAAIQGRFEACDRCLERSWAWIREADSTERDVADLMEELGGVLCDAGEVERARRVMAFAAEQWRRLGSPARAEALDERLTRLDARGEVG